MSKVTIRHVAAEAGVAVKTVSRVVNGEPNVTRELRDRVSQAVERLGYVPSMAARRMGGSRSYLLVALNDRNNTINNWRSGRGNDWIDQMLHGAMLTCEAHGYRTLFELLDGESEDLDRKVVGVLSALQPDGLILTSPHSQNEALSQMLVRRKVPVVRMGMEAQGLGIGVYMNEREAGAAATRHLAALGHVRIGFIAGSARFAASEARRQGYVDALIEAGIPIDPALQRRATSLSKAVSRRRHGFWAWIHDRPRSWPATMRWRWRRFIARADLACACRMTCRSSASTIPPALASASPR